MAIGTPVAGTYVTASASTIAVPYPTGITAGDLLLCFVSSSAGTTGYPQVPAGWTDIAGQNAAGAAPSGRWIYKVASGSESGTLTVTVGTASPKGKARMWRVSGVDTATPIEAADSYGNPSPSGTLPVPALTCSVSGCQLWAGAGFVGTSLTWVPPSSPGAFGTEVSDNTVTASTWAGYYDWSGSGSTGAITPSRAAGSSRGFAIAFALRPAGAATYDVAGTVAASSGAAATATLEAGASGTVAATPAASGSVTSLRPASGVVAATSAAAAAVTAVLLASGTAAAVSDTSGTATSLRPVAGTVAAVSGVSGAATVVSGAQTYDVAGTVAATSSAAGSVTGLLASLGSVAATSSTAASVTMTGVVTGAVAAVSGVSGSASIVGAPADYPVSGTVSAVSGVSGAVTAQYRVAGTVVVVSAASGALAATDPAPVPPSVPRRDVRVTSVSASLGRTATTDNSRRTIAIAAAQRAVSIEEDSQ